MSIEANLRTEICGVHFDTLDLAGVVSHIIERRGCGSGGWVATPNVDILRQASADPALARLVAGAPLVVLDGAPVSWAGRIAGRPPVPRVAGASLVEPLARAAAQTGAPVLLLGGRPGASERAAARLSASVPGLRIRQNCPPLGFDEDLEQWARVVASVAACEQGIVFCGFGFPKQELLMRELSLLFPRTWFLGVGGSIDFLAGAIPRAPRWVQRVGFEWAFRLITEPRRLGRRYLLDGMPFAAQMVGWALRERFRGGGAAPRRSGQIPQFRPRADVRAVDARDVVQTRTAHSHPGLPVVERIDLDGRTVAVRASGSPQQAITLTFAQYRAAVAEGNLTPIPAPRGAEPEVSGPPIPAPRDAKPEGSEVIDLRDGAVALRDSGQPPRQDNPGTRPTW